MNWKKWPYWARGGVILLIPDALAAFLLQGGGTATVGSSHVMQNINSILFYVFLSPWFVSQFLLMGHENISTFDRIWPYAVNLIIYFLIGAFLGWLYGKIRGKSKIKDQISKI